ncbi:MAG: hypothetical protein IJQ93_00570 [Bacteroidales bacterium]|nr:hypothetical protein [Bacteroidales bacterium]
MKKYFSFLTIAALGVMAISCAKEVEFNNKENTGKSISMVFSATLETDDDATKTALQDDNKVNWSKDDQILAVWDGGSKESEALTEGGASASFTVNDMEGNPQYAVYPSTLTSSYDGASFKVTIPSTQDGSFSKAAVEVAQVSDSDLAFKNLGGLMKLTITSADVRTVTISSNDGTALAGKATVTFDTAGVPSVASVEEGTSTVTLSFTGEPSTEEPYYVAVLPCELKAGVYIEFKNGEGTVIGEKMTGKTLSVARRQICNFGEVTIVTITDKYFVTVGGNGLKDGSSWENAADYAALKAHLTQNSVKNKKIYMAAGTYTSTESVTITNTSFSIFGGYPTDATGTSLAGRNITANETVFDGNNAYSIFTTNSSTINPVFDGVSFKNAANSTYNGNGSALILNKVGTAVFNSCLFDNNENTATGNTAGGIVYTGFGNITFNHCTFKNNQVTSAGGAIYANGGTIILNGCHFEKNHSGSKGTIRLAGSSAIVKMKNSSFLDNTSDEICTDISVVKGILAINNCSFSSDPAKETEIRTIPAIYNQSNMLLVNSSLQGQYNTNKGIIYNTGTTAKSIIANNIILNKYAATAQPAIVNFSSGEVSSYGYNAYYRSMSTGIAVDEDFRVHKNYLLGWNDTDKILWKSNNMFPYGPNKTAENPDSMPKGTPAKVLEAIREFDTANPTAGVETWLNGAYLKDALGTTRKTEGCWPGAYEGK